MPKATLATTRELSNWSNSSPDHNYSFNANCHQGVLSLTLTVRNGDTWPPVLRISYRYSSKQCIIPNVLGWVDQK